MTSAVFAVNIYYIIGIYLKIWNAIDIFIATN